jgi:hypothetical protein
MFYTPFSFIFFIGFFLYRTNQDPEPVVGRHVCLSSFRLLVGSTLSDLQVLLLLYCY